MTRDYKIKELLSSYLNTNEIDIQSVSGGDINDAYKIILSDQTLFLKVNSIEKAVDMFEKERIALRHMKQVVPNVPTPIKVIRGSSFVGLLMSYIPSGKKMGVEAQKNLATSLAMLHTQKHSQFGYECDNYIGSLLQRNGWKSTWKEFYILNRLEPQVKLAFDQGLLAVVDLQLFQALYLHLEDLLDGAVEANLLHGDLWGGNYMIDTEDQAWLIDPAIYFGDREVDIAMTKLFGGFSDPFYKTYQDINPMRAGYKDRLPFYQLYYLLVHLILFGASYYGSVKSIIERK